MEGAELASEKTPVIEYLFDCYWDPKNHRLQKSVMTFDDVQAAIRHCNATMGLKLSDRNPANFMKDVVRGRNASKNWPARLTELRIGAVQSPGEGNVFEFVSFPEGEDEPFPDHYLPGEDTPRFKLQSVSLPLAAKMLGRSDEPWLIQTAVNLRLVETHFAVVSSIPVVEVTHLQMSVKLRRTEIDALFLAIYMDGKEQKRVIVTCEAKQWRERILEHQVLNQAKAAFKETDVDLVIPIALRAVRRVGFYVAEFESVTRAQAAELDGLALATEAVYELCPPVRGI